MEIKRPVDTDIWNNQNLDDNILMEFENLKKELKSILKRRKRQCLDQEQSWSRNWRNTSSTWKNGIMRKRL